MASHVEQIQVTAPFAAIKGDTYPVPRIAIFDGDGVQIDPAGFTSITMNRWRATGEESEVVGVVDAMEVEFPWLAGDTDAAATWETTLTFDDNGSVYTLSSHRVNVYDLAAMWCSPADVTAIIGPGYSQYDILAAINWAENVVRAWVTSPVGSPVPARVRQATAILAARVLTADVSDEIGTGTGVIEERIADYSVTYADPQGTGTGWLLDDELQALLLPWKMRVYTTDIAEPRAATGDIEEFYA